MENKIKLQKINEKLEELYNDLHKTTWSGTKELVTSIATLENLKKEIIVKINIETLIFNLQEVIYTEVDNDSAKEYGLDLIKQLVEELRKYENNNIK